MSKIFRIVGPPGTGKTTEILNNIERDTEKYPPDQIGAISSTNSAVKEMKKRVLSQVGVGIAKHVKTIHSMCYELLKCCPEMVADKKIKEFSEEYPEFRIFSSYITEDDDNNFVDRDVIENQKNYREMQILRNRLVKKEDWPEGVLKMWTAWKAWMTKYDYIDFTGMLEEVLAIGRCIPVSVLFVDEAQDMTALQLAVVLMWAESIEVTTLVGDADQSIYRFAGATPEIFRDLKYDWGKVLTQSYRVPPAVHKLSMDILSQIRDREQIEYVAFCNNGEGQVVSTLKPDFSLPGSHMLICRCNFRIPHWQEKLRDENILWNNPYRDEPGWNPASTQEYLAIQSWLKLRSLDTLTLKEFQNMVDKMISQGNLTRGAKTRIEHLQNVDADGLCMWHLNDLGFVENFIDKTDVDQIFRVKTEAGTMAINLAKKGILGKEKTVILGTIHSVKGGEADHVWIDQRKTKKILQAVKDSETAKYDELRIKYVAVTRARQTVGLLCPGRD